MAIETAADALAGIVGLAFIVMGTYFAAVVRRKDLAGYAWMYAVAGGSLILLSVRHSLANNSSELLLRGALYTTVLLIGWNLFWWIIRENDVTRPRDRVGQIRHAATDRRRIRRRKSDESNERIETAEPQARRDETTERE